MKTEKHTIPHIGAPFAVALESGWVGYHTAREARIAAWQARGGRGGTPPAVYQLTADGWLQLKPGPPKTSGASGQHHRGILYIRLSKDEIAKLESIAQSLGLTVHAWAREAIRQAAT